MAEATPADSRSTKVRVSVVLVHWNTPDLTARALAAIEGACAGVPYEVLVVDNGSTMGPPVGEGDDRVVRWIRNARNRGFAAAANQGAAIARGEYLLFLNSDAVLRRGSVERLLEAFECDRGIAALAPTAQGIAGPRSPAMRFLGPLDQSAALLGWRSRRLVGEVAAVTQDRSVIEVDWVCGSTMLAQTRAVRSVCGFDEGYFFYEEDEDLCWRLRRRGWRIAWLRSVEVDDPGGCSTQLAGDWPLEQLYRGQIRFLRRRAGRLAVGLFRIAVSVALVAKLAYRVGRRRQAAVSRDWTIALATLWGVSQATRG